MFRSCRTQLSSRVDFRRRMSTSIWCRSETVPAAAAYVLPLYLCLIDTPLVLVVIYIIILLFSEYLIDVKAKVVVVVVVVTRSDQPKPPAVAIVRQNGLSSSSCRASVAVIPVSRQIWWIQVVGGRPLARLHSCEGRSPSLVLVQIRRIWFNNWYNNW